MGEWVSQAISRIEANFKRSPDTHLPKVELPSLNNIHLYLKDEPTHPTGSLKHRSARSLLQDRRESTGHYRHSIPNRITHVLLHKPPAPTAVEPAQ